MAFTRIDSAARKAPAHEAPDPTGRGARSGDRFRPLVLLVEDDPHERELYGKTLWYNGFDVVQSENGEEAVDLAVHHHPDLVVVDLLLPRMNGIEACRRIKGDSRTSDIPVIALTARAEREFGDLARHAGCQRYLEKPIGPLSVLSVVEEMLGPAPPAGEDPDRV